MAPAALPLVLLALAQEPLDLPLEGVVRAADGAPVAGAEVLVTRRADWIFDPPIVLREAVTDGEGRFHTSLPADWLAEPSAKFLGVFALAPEGGFWGTELGAEHIPAGEPLAITLPAVEPWTVRVVRADGTPAAGARLALHGVARPDTYSVWLPRELRERLVAVADDEGVARVTAFARDQVGALAVDTGDCVQELRTQVLTGGWLGDRIRLEPTAPVRLTVAEDVDPATAGALVAVETWHGNSREPGSISTTVAWRFPLPAPGESAQGRVGLSRAHAILRFDGTPALNLVSDAVQTDPEREAELVVRAAEPVLVSGRVLGPEGEPVAGAVLTVFSPGVRGWVETDASGTYRLRAKAGHLQISDIRAGGAFWGRDFPPELRGLSIPEDVEAFELPPARATSLLPVTGVVLGADGEPLEGALVLGHGKGDYATQALARTDAAGLFRLVRPLDGRTELTARLGSAATSAPVVPKGRPVTLELSRFVSARASVRVEGGVPEGATVELWRATPQSNYSIQERLTLTGAEQLPLPADGVFESPAGLDPDGRYRLAVRAPGLVPRATPLMSGAELAAGVDLELDRLTALEGRAVGADGVPVGGARVFARSSAFATTGTTTDAEGRFRLEGLIPGPGTVFLDLGADGLRGARYGEDRSLDWRLAPAGDAAALEPEPPHDRALELGLGRAVLGEALAAARAAEDEYAVLRDLQQLARADPAETLRVLDESGLDEYMRCMVRRSVLDGLAADSPEEALAVAESMTLPSFGTSALVAAARALPGEEHARRLELAGLALAKAQRVPEPDKRLVYVSQVGELLTDLGEHERARELLEDAVPLADTLAREGWPGYARSAFAEELALYDLDTAKRLIDEMASDGDPDRHLGNVAHELASRDPARAEEVFKSIPQGSFGRERYVAPVCHDMAPVDLPRARGIADAFDPSGFTHGLMAGAVAANDPEAARELLAEAFRRLESSRAKQVRVPHFATQAVLGAALLPIVEAVAPETLEERLWCVLSLRAPQPDPVGTYAASIRTQEDPGVAFFLARYDRAAARELVEQALALADPQGRRPSDRSALYAAAAVVDPEWAARLAREADDERGLRTVGAVLAREGEERVRFVQEEILNLWVVGKEDL